jgi:hypothetical protein
MDNHQTHHLESVFALSEAGVLKDDLYDAYRVLFCAIMATLGGAAWWSKEGLLHIASLVSPVDARLSRGDLPNVLDFAVFAEPPASEQRDKI